jgi:hypothetical protein
MNWNLSQNTMQAGVNEANPNTRAPTLGFGVSRLIPTCMKTIFLRQTLLNAFLR